MIEFINIFFVPLIALFMQYKRKGIEPKFSPAFIMEYSISAVAILIITKIIITFICVFIPSADLAVETVKYTILAVVAVVIWMFIYDFFKKHISVEVSVDKNEKK